MAYFNHAFSKMFLGTGETRAVSPVTTGGFITTAGIPTGSTDTATNVPVGTVAASLSNLPVGYFGFFDPNTYLSVNTASLPSPGSSACCPLILASSSVLTNDKIGPFHGGYKETNKSKLINPKYVQKAYWVEPCVPKQAVVSVGNTSQTGAGAYAGALTAGGTTYTNSATGYVVPTTGGTGTGATLLIIVAGGIVTSASIVEAGIGYSPSDVLTIVGGDNLATFTLNTAIATPPGVATTTPVNFQGGTTAATCCFEFLCGETYYLRIDVKGSPALRALNHNAYQTLSAYTGCCSGPTPTAVDSTLVMIEWAKALVINNYLKPFIMPVVFDEVGTAWYAPGTTVDPLSGAAITSAQWWDAYVSPGHVAGKCAGLRLIGAFVETKFGDCTFQVTDFFEKEPIKIYASMVDYTGDPCVFEGICVYNDCLGLQGMGFGEQVVRDLIKAESYLQNFFHSGDFRVREITQGYDMTSAINRNALYSRYFILHSVPRFNNPTGVFDNDRYMLEIIIPEANPAVPVGNVALDLFLTTWLGNCANCVELEQQSCTYCVPANN
jgi:hypothetical protein